MIHTVWDERDNLSKNRAKSTKYYTHFGMKGYFIPKNGPKVQNNTVKETESDVTKSI